MRPFLAIGLPEPVSYDEFTQIVVQPSESTLDLLKYAGEATAGAKKGFEVLSKLDAEEAFCQGSHDSWVKNVKDCLKACIFTSITISSVQKAIEVARKNEKVNLKVEIPPTGKSYHDWWVVPKVTST